MHLSIVALVYSHACCHVSLAWVGQVLGAVAVIARLNPGLALVALALTPLLSRLTRLVVVRTARVAYRQQTAASDALKFADERLAQVGSPPPSAFSWQYSGAIIAHRLRDVHGH